MRQMIKGIVLAAVVVAGATACGDDTSSGKDAGITIADAWARTSPMNVSNGAAYMTIASPVDDALVGASVDASVAATVEIHETVAVDPSATESSGMTESTGMPGATVPAGETAMQMRPVASIALTANSPLKMQPGGYHVMLLDLASPLAVGSTFELTLTFEKAGTKTITVPVRDDAP